MPRTNVAGFEGISSNVTFLDQCTPELCSLKYATLDYVPSLEANVAFGAIFAILFVSQIGMWLFSRTHSYGISMCCGLTLEIVGYVFRALMRDNMFNDGPFLIQIITIIIAPVFFTGAVYLTLSRLITHYGVHNSRLSPKTYTLAFIASDFLALVLQSAGGALAETANDKATSKAGTNIMVGGLAFQVASLTVFSMLAAEFFWRVKGDRKHIRSTNWAYGLPEKPEGDIDGLKTLVIAFAFATLLILIRSSFRVAELVNGFDSKLANDQVLFMVLEGGMVIFAALIMTVFHPGKCFKADMWRQSGWRSSKRGADDYVWKMESVGSSRGSSVNETYENVSRPWPIQS